MFCFAPQPKCSGPLAMLWLQKKKKKKKLYRCWPPVWLSSPCKGFSHLLPAQWEAPELLLPPLQSDNSPSQRCVQLFAPLHLRPLHSAHCKALERREEALTTHVTQLTGCPSQHAVLHSAPSLVFLLSVTAPAITRCVSHKPHTVQSFSWILLLAEIDSESFWIIFYFVYHASFNITKYCEHSFNFFFYKYIHQFSQLEKIFFPH